MSDIMCANHETCGNDVDYAHCGDCMKRAEEMAYERGRESVAIDLGSMSLSRENFTGSHTPGPWKQIGPLPVVGGGKAFAIGAESLTVALVMANDEDLAPARADCALIAAAPDLLKVVDGLLQVCHRGPDESKGGTGEERYSDWKQRMISEAIDAITKARGGK